MILKRDHFHDRHMGHVFFPFRADGGIRFTCRRMGGLERCHPSMQSFR